MEDFIIRFFSYRAGGSSSSNSNLPYHQQNSHHQHQQKASDDGSICSNGADSSLLDNHLLLNFKQKLKQNFILTVSIAEFLSSIVLTLVSVSTLPWVCESLHVFLPGFTVSALCALAGAYSVCIVWLDVTYAKNKCMLRSAIGLNALSLPLVILIWSGVIARLLHDLDHNDFYVKQLLNLIGARNIENPSQNYLNEAAGGSREQQQRTVRSLLIGEHQNAFACFILSLSIQIPSNGVMIGYLLYLQWLRGGIPDLRAQFADKIVANLEPPNHLVVMKEPPNRQENQREEEGCGEVLKATKDALKAGANGHNNAQEEEENLSSSKTAAQVHSFVRGGSGEQRRFFDNGNVRPAAVLRRKNFTLLEYDNEQQGPKNDPRTVTSSEQQRFQQFPIVHQLPTTNQQQPQQQQQQHESKLNALSVTTPSPRFPTLRFPLGSTTITTKRTNKILDHGPVILNNDEKTAGSEPIWKKRTVPQQLDRFGGKNDLHPPAFEPIWKKQRPPAAGRFGELAAVPPTLQEEEEGEQEEEQTDRRYSVANAAVAAAATRTGGSRVSSLFMSNNAKDDLLFLRSRQPSSNHHQHNHLLPPIMNHVYYYDDVGDDDDGDDGYVKNEENETTMEEEEEKEAAFGRDNDDEDLETEGNSRSSESLRAKLFAKIQTLPNEALL